MIGIIKLLLFMVLTSSFNLKASAQTLTDAFDFWKSPGRFLLAHPELMQMQVNELLKTRCEKYILNHRQCSNASKKFIESLQIEPLLIEDVKNNKTIPFIITFAKDLQTIYQDPRTDLFLTELNRQFDQLEQDIKIYKFILPSKIKKVDLGRLAMKYYGNFPEALRALATLFQDMPTTEIQTYYLNQKMGKTTLVKKIHTTLGRFSGLFLSKTEYGLTYFERPLLNARVYHTLVPSYLALKLQMAGYSPEISFLMPYMFNYLYEAGAQEGHIKTYFFEPKSIVRVQSQNDIIAGEIGAKIGVGISQLILPKDQAQELLIKSPKNFIQELIKNINSNP